MQTTVATVAPQRSRTGVERWAWLTLGFFILVVLEGAVVRLTSSGAGCGDRWPLCNGEILPHHPRMATVIEFVHRSLTGISSTLFAVLIAWTLYATPRKHPARRAATTAGLLLVVEAALGAVLVLGHYVEHNTSTTRVILQAIHFTNTMLLLAATAATARLLRPARAGHHFSTSVRTAAIVSAALALIVGATGSLAALADTLFPSPTLSAALRADFAANAPALIRMRWIHPASTALLAIAVFALFLRLARESRRSTALLVAASLIVQIVLGIADVLLLAPAWLQVLHLLGADIFWITLIVIATDCIASRETNPLMNFTR